MQRKRDPETIEKLKELRQRMMSSDISRARVAGFQLSWLQEDGMAVLQEALFGNYSQTTKRAAAYGLRSMRGRMKTLATEVLERGAVHHDPETQQISKTSLGLMRGEITIAPPKRKKQPYGKRPPQKKGYQSKRQIRSMPSEPNGNVTSYRSKKTHRSRGQ